MNKTSIVRLLNALLALVLVGILCGAIFNQFFRGEGPPCPLCLLQRVGMIGVATGALFNLRFGVHVRYYAISLISAFVGGTVSLRQIALHVCPGDPGYGLPEFGFSLWTWAFISFVCVFIVILLLLYTTKDKVHVRMNWFEKAVFAIVMLMTATLVILTIDECGVGYCADVPWPPAETQTHYLFK